MIQNVEVGLSRINWREMELLHCMVGVVVNRTRISWGINEQGN